MSKIIAKAVTIENIEEKLKHNQTVHIGYLAKKQEKKGK